MQYAATAQLCRAQQTPSRRCSAVLAGLALEKSQKIHNQLAGVAAAAPETRYFLFLDDDVCLYPSTVELLVGVLEADPEAFMATGYPFDVPHPHAGFWSLCVMVGQRARNAVHARFDECAHAQRPSTGLPPPAPCRFLPWPGQQERVGRLHATAGFALFAWRMRDSRVGRRSLQRRPHLGVAGWLVTAPHSVPRLRSVPHPLGATMHGGTGVELLAPADIRSRHVHVRPQPVR